MKTARLTSVALERDALSQPDRLSKTLDSVDSVIHAAGVNRGEPGSVRSGNIIAAEQLAAGIAGAEKPVRVVYANSVKSGDPSPYGEGKAAAAEILRNACSATGSAFVDVQLPHLFGECGVPYYNSAVATFAFDIAKGRHSEVNRSGRLELLHAQDAAASLIERAVGSPSKDARLRGREISVGGAYDLLERLADEYAGAQIPALVDRFELLMFNMLRAQLFPARYPIVLTDHRDERGSFVEIVRSHGEGQTSISTTQPGITRGEHFHIHKIERFVVLSGEARMKVRRLDSSEVASFDVSGDDPVAVDMPTLHAHNIQNIGRTPLITMFWTNELFDAAHPDTYPSSVEGSP